MGAAPATTTTTGILRPPLHLNSRELRAHNTSASAIVAIRGQLYDLSRFVNSHPGGSDILLLAAGRDVTQVYETYHDTAKTEKVLRKFHVGTLTDSALPTFPPPSKFQTTLRKRITDHFKRTGQDPKFHPLHLIHYAVVIGTIALSYYAQFWVPQVRDSALYSTVAAIVLGVFCAQSCFTIVHDASHASFSHRPWIWTLLGAWHDFFNGASHVAWFHQHVLGHHPYTNLRNADPDVGAPQKDFRRIRPHQQWFSFYTLQHIYAPFVYGFYGLKSRWDDIDNIYIKKRSGPIEINPLQPHQHALFWAGKAFFVFYRVYLPSLFVPLPRVLALFMVADIATSLTLTLVFQANHVVEHVAWPEADKTTNVVPVDWMEMQIITAQDYCHDQFWPTKFTGALNYQVVHHAFPNICQWWYTDIGPIVKDACKEFGVEYCVRDSFYAALKDHIDLLWAFGHDTAPTTTVAAQKGASTGVVRDKPGYINGALKEE